MLFRLTRQYRTHPSLFKKDPNPEEETGRVPAGQEAGLGCWRIEESGSAMVFSFSPEEGDFQDAQMEGFSEDLGSTQFYCLHRTWKAVWPCFFLAVAVFARICFVQQNDNKPSMA